MTRSVPDPATGLPIGLPADATPARRPDRATALEGRIVRLVGIDPALHAADLFEAASGPGTDATWLYIPDGPFLEFEALRDHLARLAGSPDPLIFAVTERGSGRALGYAAFMRIDPANRVIEVGHVVFTPRLQRTPAATEAIFLMMRHVFDDLGYRRFEWKCNALNAPSRRAALRFGFTYEGTFRNHTIVKGRSRDTAWYSITDDEWPARKTAFERWLAPDNFGPDGGQRLPLSGLNAAELAAGDAALRRATLADAPAFEALQRSAYAWNRAMLGVEPLPLMVPTATVLGRYETWLLEPDGHLDGALALDPQPADLTIWSVSVDPARQNAGIGRTLLAAAEQRARDLGLSTMRLFTGEKLAKNIEWYRRRGYEVERIEDLPDRRAVHMVKTI